MHKRTVIVMILGVLGLLVASDIFSQNQIISIDEPLKAQRLSGRVQLGDHPSPVRGVLVELCTKDWKAVKTSTHTDENGHFEFPRASKRELHYLRFSLYGAHTLLVKVKIDRSGPKELSISLTFAT